MKKSNPNTENRKQRLNDAAFERKMNLVEQLYPLVQRYRVLNSLLQEIPNRDSFHQELHWQMTFLTELIDHSLPDH